MNVETKKKVHLNYLSIIVGTKCNLKCAHCLGGNPEAMTIKPEFVDAMLDNLTGINELQIIGYEPTLYIDSIKMIFSKIIERKMKVNYLTFYTNCAVFSKEFADIFNDFRLNHTTFPKEALFQTSVDKFHYNSGFTKEKFDENIKKYQNEIKDCDFDFMDLNNGIILIGRAKNLTNTDLKEYDSVALQCHGKPEFEFRHRCEGSQNTCNNGKCICNCIVNNIYLLPNGYIYNSDVEAFYALSEKDYCYAIGYIEDGNLYDMVNNYQYVKYDNRVPYQDYKSYFWNTRFLLNAYLEFREEAILSFQKQNCRLYSVANDRLVKKIRLTNERIRMATGDDIGKRYFWNTFARIKSELAIFEKIRETYFFSSTNTESAYKEIEVQLIDNSRFAPHSLKANFGYDYDSFRDIWRYYDASDFDNYYKAVMKVLNEDDNE